MYSHRPTEQWVSLQNHTQLLNASLYGPWHDDTTMTFIYGHFPGGPGLAGTRTSPFWILLELRIMEVAVTTGSIRCAKLLSNRHHQQTNTQLFTGRMPFMSPNQQCQSIEEEKVSNSTDLLTPSSPGGLQTFSLTTKGSWLPWGKAAKPSALRRQYPIADHDAASNLLIY